MQVTYTQRPSRVSVFAHTLGTDIFLRRNIVEREDEETGQTLYECEEVQARLSTPVTVDGIETDFDGWWEIIASTPKPQQRTTAQQLAQLRADVDWVAAVSGIDLGV